MITHADLMKLVNRYKIQKPSHAPYWDWIADIGGIGSIQVLATPDGRAMVNYRGNPVVRWGLGDDVYVSGLWEAVIQLVLESDELSGWEVYQQYCESLNTEDA